MGRILFSAFLFFCENAPFSSKIYLFCGFFRRKDNAKRGWSIMAKEYKLTRERVKQLQDELEYLRTVREKEVADMIKEARSFGDLSENSEYDEAKNEQGRVYSRISELTDILSNYTIIENEATGQIGPGAKVLVRDVEFGDEETFEIVGSQEANPEKNRISDESPLGRALIGHKEGEKIVAKAPAGEIEYEILNVQW